MNPNLIKILKCPVCWSDELSAISGHIDNITYQIGEIPEIKEGLISCGSCETEFPIKDYIPVFPSSSEKVSREGRYWEDYYSTLSVCGIQNFVDYREDFLPFYNLGITLRLSARDREKIESIREIYKLERIWLFQNEEYSIFINNAVAEQALEPDARVLEIGCGSGWLSLALSRRGFQVVGIDPAMAALRVAKNHAIETGHYIEYINTNAEYLPFKDSSFDGCFIFHALHHIPNPDAVFLRLRQIIRKDGVFSMYEHRKPLLLVDAVEFGAYFLLSPLLRKRYGGVSMCLPKSTSANENVSVSEMDNVAEYFDLKLKQDFHHILSNLSLFMYYLSNRNWRVFISTALVLNKALQVLPKSTANFALFAGFNNRDHDSVGARSPSLIKTCSRTNHDISCK